MKNVWQHLTKRAGIIGVAGLMATSLSGCLKGNNTTNTTQAVTYLSVINASPDSQPQDFYVDQALANAYPITYNTGLNYLRINPGKRTTAFYVSGTQQKVKSDTVTLVANKYYTLYLTNATAHPDFLFLTDTIAQPASGMAAIRFVNVSPDAPAVDLVAKNGNVLVANKSYKGFSSFIPVTGNVSYTFEIHRAGTATVLATVSAGVYNSGSVYTIWLHGFAAATDQTALAADVQQNANY